MSLVTTNGRRESLALNTLSMLNGLTNQQVANLGELARAGGKLLKNSLGSEKSSKKSKPAKEKKAEKTDLVVDSSAAPISMGMTVKGRKAKISSGRNSTLVSHTELLDATYSGSTGFSIDTTYVLNPGLASSFPYLSTLAPQFEQYEWEELTFHFYPSAPTTTAGDVILIPEYNAQANPPTTEVQAFNHHGSVISAAWKPCSLSLDVKAMHQNGRKFVRTGAVPGDIKLYDAGLMYQASTSEASTAAIGKFFVSYKCRLYVPFNGPSRSLYPSRCSYSDNVGVATGTTSSTTVPIIWNSFASGFNPLNIATPNSNDFVPPAGVYKILFHGVFADSAAEAFTVTVNIRKNGAVYGVTSINGPISGSANSSRTISVFTIMPVNGTDTVGVYFTPVGAAGTLSCLAGGAAISFEVV